MTHQPNQIQILPTTDFKAGMVLLIDKPYQWTSFNVVSKIRTLLKHHTGDKKIKVGHAGTLDPLATGLLVICIGRATKSVNQLTAQDKTYEATFKLGQTTPSFDLEKEIDQTYPTQHINNELIKKVVANFIGKQQQVPPIFSAKLIDGKRAYKFARQGLEPEMKPVPIEIFNIDILKFEMPLLKLKIHCSKGTYIRALARDLGIALNSGAHLVELRRTQSGQFNINQALTITEFEKIITSMQPIQKTCV